MRLHFPNGGYHFMRAMFSSMFSLEYPEVGLLLLVVFVVVDMVAC